MTINKAPRGRKPKITAEDWVKKITSGKTAVLIGVVRRATKSIPAHLAISDIGVATKAMGFKPFLGRAQLIIILDPTIYLL